MSKPGYHPTCVLFQGNDCAFDGTYRLVCRHQIRPKDFQPGDNVEVNIGDDEDDVREQDNNDTNGDGTRWRDAIALGDEMVMSLLRNMCKNQPAGKTPWGANNRQEKRKHDRDETDAVKTKRIKSEECTTSQTTVNRIEEHSGQDDNHLQSIRLAICSVQAATDLVSSELSSIRKGQQLLSEQVTTLQKTLNCLEDSTKLCNNPSQDCGSEQGPTPVSLFLSSTPTSPPLGSIITSSGHHSPMVQATDAAPSTTSASSYPEIVIVNPRSQAQPELSSFPTQDAQDPSLSSLPPLYPIEESPESLPQVSYNYRFTDATHTKVFLGHHDSPVTLFKRDMDAILSRSNTPTAFAYRLAGQIFTNEELFNGNLAGKGQMKSGKPFQQLNPKYISLILMEVAAQFPTFQNDHKSTRSLHAAIGERCRNERKKLIYCYHHKTNPDTTI